MQVLDRRGIQAILIVTLLVASLFGLWAAERQRHKYLNDDTLITLTYAKNLAAGRGFVFNHAPATLGTTTPLLAVTVGGLAALLPAVSAIDLAVFLTALCWIAVPWILFAFHRAWGLQAWQAVVIGLVVIASGWVNLLGMEGYLFAALLILSFSWLYTGRHLAAGVTAALLFLTRGEGALVLLLLLVTALWQAWRDSGRISVTTLLPALRLLLGFALPILVWSVYAYLTFGRVLPDTLAAKIAQGQAGFWPTLFDELRQTWLPAWGASFRLAQVPVFNLWWILVLTGLVSALVTYRRWLVLAAWGILYTASYSVLHVAAYWWYQLPIVFVLQLFAGLGLVAVVTLAFRLNQHVTAPRTLHPVVSLGARVAALALVVLVLYVQFARTWQTVTQGPGDFQRGKSLAAVSRWLTEHTAPADSVAYIEVGYLGYYTPNRIVDLVGLVTPEIASHVADRDFAWGFWQYQPDYFLYLPTADWALKAIHDDARFAQQYQAVAELPGPRAGTQFTIYRRVTSGN